MFPTIEEARKELELAEKLNPGPWVKHSINAGILWICNSGKTICGCNAQIWNYENLYTGVEHDVSQ